MTSQVVLFIKGPNHDSEHASVVQQRLVDSKHCLLLRLLKGTAEKNY